MGVVVFDARSGRVASVNQESRRIVGDLCMPGQSAEDLLKVLRVRRADGHEVAFEESPLTQMLRNATTVRAEEIVLEVPDGRRITILVNATPIRTEQGEVESLVVTLQDLTPLEELERLRAEFLGMVSHELRAPLTSIKGSAATVLGAPRALDPAETMQFLRIIDEQADHMRELISDLLDAAHIETGRLSVTPEPVELAAVMDQARNMYLSGGGRNPLRIDLPPDLPRVLADRQRIVQVLGNLLSNAARHSPESSAIRVAAVREDVHVAVSVADEGRSIPAERLPHLFRKFARSGREDRGRGVGAGLGLAICKGLVEAHGGRIWAESEGTGPGARFTFTIPVVEEAGVGVGVAASPVRGPGRPGRAGEEGPHVLVVDDDPKALGYVRGILEDTGYYPFVTGDPEDVPGLIETYRPDLVLLDLLLPGTDGIELMQSLPALADLPVIFLSGYGRDETIARALEIGAADYIVKPFSSDGARGQNRGRPAQAGRDARALPDGGARHQLRRAPGELGRPACLADRHRVRSAERPLGQRRPRIDARLPAAPRMAFAARREPPGSARLHQEASPEAGRRCEQPDLHPHRAAGRLPHGQARGRLRVRSLRRPCPPDSTRRIRGTGSECRMGSGSPKAEGPGNRLRAIGSASVPVTVGVPLEGIGEARIALTSSD